MEKKFIASFDIGEIVYHVVDGCKGMIVSYSIDRRDVMYKVSFGHNDTQYCYAV
jgi:hypothetical protein